MAKTESLPIVLIVSADSYKSAFFKRSLKGMFQVIDASDSFMAVDWLGSVQAAVIILDEKTFADTWTSIVEKIRNLSGYRAVPILLITNNLKKNFLVKAMNIGITDFLNEPFDADEVFQRILVATQSKPATKKVSMMTKKFKKAATTSLPKLSAEIVGLDKNSSLGPVLKKVNKAKTRAKPKKNVSENTQGDSKFDR